MRYLAVTKVPSFLDLLETDSPLHCCLLIRNFCPILVEQTRMDKELAGGRLSLPTPPTVALGT